MTWQLHGLGEEEGRRRGRGGEEEGRKVGNKGKEKGKRGSRKGGGCECERFLNTSRSIVTVMVSDAT